jgi:cytochrome c biogenesis protein
MVEGHRATAAVGGEHGGADLMTTLSIAREAWRRLRTMKTAIILLFVLAAAAAVGSLVPQRPVNDLAVIRWKQAHSAYAGIAEHAGLFDVYGSAWFNAIYGLLLVSLAGCLVPRYRAFLRVVRSRPRTRTTLSNLATFRHGMSRLQQDDALAGAEKILKRRRFRLTRSDGAIAGEKGHLREGGSLIFHSAFFVLLLGVALSKGFGFSGQTAVVEGSAFTDTHIGYDSIREGRFFQERDHTGMSVVIDRFDVSWYPNGVPRDFVSHVHVVDGDRTVRTGTIRVNHPMTYRGVTMYQLAWGWAPRVQVLQHGKLISDSNVVFLQDQRSGNWHGVVKVPSATPLQLGVEMFFFNDLQLGPKDVPFNATPYPSRPFIFFQEFRGNLGLNQPQSVYQLDKTRLAPAKVGGLPLGGSMRLDDGIEVRFPSLAKYSVLQFTRNPGAWVLFAAAVLILVGLIPALYSSRRRVWIRAIPAGDAVRIEVAGQALQRKAAFEEEFTALVRELGRDLHVEQPAAPAARVESGIDAS